MSKRTFAWFAVLIIATYNTVEFLLNGDNTDYIVSMIFYAASFIIGVIPKGDK